MSFKAGDKVRLLPRPELPRYVWTGDPTIVHQPGDIVEVSEDVADGRAVPFRENGRHLLLNPKDIELVSGCQCSIDILMAHGCQCGGT
jgi:hypothetical protein